MDEHQEIYRRLALALAAEEKDKSEHHPGGLAEIDYVQYLLMRQIDIHGLEIRLCDGELTA